ncbi:uncharacterized protein N7500_006343 [Penicillium coprophilum]|uniref:uncharacterized protein n=1 Tax=Penicillium coprophilum TaxID=36646 RepID=UPI002392A0F1|nr:uncharacterized protein N7500_006343 [Penicillium coprophilum]KAJ5164513.1 hypothetical protein N7500_006343 [Penicillium coprophilum]
MTPRQTPLSIAANGGHDAIVKLLLDHGAQLNDVVKEEKRWAGRMYPAVRALLAGHESTLRLLLESGAQTEGSNLLFGGLINCAVASGQMPMLKLLMQFGVDVNAQVHGVSPLLWAVRRKPNYASLVEVLLDHGADIALADDDRGGLIREALEKGTLETVDLLLRRGANLHASMLKLAASRCTLETVRLLLDHGARVSLASVMRAVISKKCDILELLLGRGFDLNERTPEGYTVLHHAIHCCEIRPPIRASLRPPIRRQHPAIGGCDGSDISTLTPVFPQRSSSLHVAAYCRKEDDSGTSEEIVRCLIRWGADVNAMDGERQTPLYYAWKYASPAVQHMLLENGADWTAMLTKY